MKMTGQILKENRERRGVTLNEVSLSTKITLKTLIAIEEGNPMNLPPKTFLRGFVRSYAIFLGLDPEEILKTFHEEMGSTVLQPAGNKDSGGETAASSSNLAEVNSAATETAAAPSSENKTQKRNNDTESLLSDDPTMLSRALIGGGIVVLIAIIVLLMNKMESYEAERVTGPTDSISVETAAPGIETQEEPVDSPTPPPEEGATAALASPSPTPVAVIAAETPTPSPTPKSTATPSPSPTPTPKPTATPTPTPTPAPTASPTPKPTASATPKPSASPVPSATPAPAAPTGRNNEILIEALDNVDIEAVIDGETARPLKLKAEQVQTIKAKRRVTLRLSNGGAVNIVVNGIDRGVPGDLGKPLKVDLP